VHKKDALRKVRHLIADVGWERYPSKEMDYGREYPEFLHFKMINMNYNDFRQLWELAGLDILLSLDGVYHYTIAHFLPYTVDSTRFGKPVLVRSKNPSLIMLIAGFEGIIEDLVRKVVEKK
jgi:hypothetical protein